MKFVIYQPDSPIRLADIPDGNISMGRELENDIVINDPKISRNHARIFQSDGMNFIEDMGSRAGTILNGRRIDGLSRIKIKPGDELLLGETRICIERGKNSEETVFFQDAAPSEGTSGSMAINADPQEAKDKHITTKFLPPKMWEERVTPRCHRLIQIENGNLGRPYLLNQSEVCIGRSPKCEIKLINDLTISSFHAVLTLGNNRYWIKDFNSRNGSMINGKRIKKPVKIHHGDRIRIGETQFVYINRESSFPLETYKHFLKPRPPRWPKRLLLFALFIALGISFTFGQSFWASHLRAAGILAAASEPIETQEIKLGNSVMMELSDRRSTEIDMASASQFETSHLWQEAAEIYEKVLHDAPHLSAAVDGLGRCRSEMKHQIIFEKGLSLYEQGEWAKAIKNLDKISKESVYSAKALEKLELASANLEKSPPVEAPKQAAKVVAPDTEAQSHMASAVEYYASGYFQPALNALQQGLEKNYAHDAQMKKELQQTQEAIRNIEQMTEEGRELYLAGDVDEAFKKWEYSLKLDRVLVGTAPSASAERIGLYVAEEFCRRAKMHFEGENDEEALKLVELAERASPGHQGAIKIRALVENRRQKATIQKRFEEAVQIMDIDLSAAIRKWEEIVALTGKDNEYHRESKAMIGKYRNGRRLLPDGWTPN
jgi:pSer/pThr/pTyr-binding forkhead associated (FHA) protein